MGNSLNKRFSANNRRVFWVQAQQRIRASKHWGEVWHHRMLRNVRSVRFSRRAKVPKTWIYRECSKRRPTYCHGRKLLSLVDIWSSDGWKSQSYIRIPSKRHNCLWGSNKEIAKSEKVNIVNKVVANFRRCFGWALKTKVYMPCPHRTQISLGVSL